MNQGLINRKTEKAEAKHEKTLLCWAVGLSVFGLMSVVGQCLDHRISWLQNIGTNKLDIANCLDHAARWLKLIEIERSSGREILRPGHALIGQD